MITVILLPALFLKGPIDIRFVVVLINEHDDDDDDDEKLMMMFRCWLYNVNVITNVMKQASKLILLASKTIHSDNYQIIQILCDAKWRG